MALPIPLLAVVLAAGLLASLVMNRLILRWYVGKPWWGRPGRCSWCGGPMPWRAAIPGLEWVDRKARPRCGHTLPPWRILTVIVFLVGGAGLVWLHREAPWPLTAQAMILLFVLYPLAMIDLGTMSVEARLLMAGLILRFAGLAFFEPRQIVPMIAGMLIGAGLFAMVETMYHTLRGRPGLGQGDAAVMGFIGAFVGWEGVMPVVTLAAVGGLLVGAPLLLLTRSSLATPIPFVPFLASAGFVVYLGQNVWAGWWWRWLAALFPPFLR